MTVIKMKIPKPKIDRDTTERWIFRGFVITIVLLFFFCPWASFDYVWSNKSDKITQDVLYSGEPLSIDAIEHRTGYAGEYFLPFGKSIRMVNNVTYSNGSSLYWFNHYFVDCFGSVYFMYNSTPIMQP